MDFPVDLFIPELYPTSMTPQGIARYLVENMQGSVSEGLMDISELDQPIIDIPSSGTDAIIAGSVKVTATPTDNHVHSFQDKSGTVALLEDTYGIRDTLILPEGLISVDWDKASSFMTTLSGNRASTLYMFHSRPGMQISILIVNNGTNQVVGVFDPLIKWPSGVTPPVPAAKPGMAASLLATLRNINGTIYGESVNQDQYPSS